MDRWEIILLAVGMVVAVSSLVKLMRARRDLLVAQVKSQVEHNKKVRKAKLAKQNEEAA